MNEPVRRELLLSAPVQAVWAAITEADAIATWFGALVEIDPRTSGAVRFTWADGKERRGIILAVDPERRLEFRWAASDGSPPDTSVVVFELEPTGEGTRVVVSETPGILGDSGRNDLAEVSP